LGDSLGESARVHWLIVQDVLVDIYHEFHEVAVSRELIETLQSSALPYTIVKRELMKLLSILYYT